MHLKNLSVTVIFISIIFQLLNLAGLMPLFIIFVLLAQLAIGFFLRERPVVAIATVATAVVR